jgi:hypothetical protein
MATLFCILIGLALLNLAATLVAIWLARSADSVAVGAQREDARRDSEAEDATLRSRSPTSRVARGDREK